MAGSGWPERHRRRSDLLRTCHRHQVGTARPKARSDRTKWSGGSADGRVQSSVSELLQSAALCAKISRVSKIFLSVKVVPHIQGVPGSHWGIPGGLGGAPSGRSSVPTAMDGADDISRVGIRVKGYCRNYFGRSAPDASAITQGTGRCRCGGRMTPPSRRAHAAPLRACARPYGMANGQGVGKWQVPSCARRASITSPAGEIKMSRCAHALEPA